MAYATVDQLAEYLDQMGIDTPIPAARLERILYRASAILDREMLPFQQVPFGTTVTGTRRIYADTNGVLHLPLFVADSITAVTSPGGVVPAYSITNQDLIAAKTVYSTPHTAYIGWGSSADLGGWIEGVPYDVTATWGSASVPADIVEACLELAVRIERRRAGGFSNVVENDVGNGYEGTFPPLVQQVLMSYGWQKRK